MAISSKPTSGPAGLRPGPIASELPVIHQQWSYLCSGERI